MPAKRHSLADFRELAAACRELGVTHVELEGMKLVMGPKPLPDGERKRMTPEELADVKRAKRDGVMFAHTSMRPVRRP